MIETPLQINTVIREINEREVWVDDRLRFLHLATSPRDLVATDTLKKKLARLEAEVCIVWWIKEVSH